MNSLLRSSQKFYKKHASTILTIAGGVGLVATAVTAVKATPKAMTLLEKAEKEKGEDLTKIEIIKVAGPSYIPSILIGAGSLACIFGANVLSKRQQAALLSAYTLVDNSFKQYKNKLKELYGEETHQNVVNAIAVEKAKDVKVTGVYFCETCDLTTLDACGEPILFYEEFSDRYFEATIEQVLNAEYHVNRNYALRGYVYLNELYEFLGLDGNDYGSVMGWAPTDDGEYWVEFNHRMVTLDDGLEVCVIEMPFGPTYEPWEC